MKTRYYYPLYNKPNIGYTTDMSYCHFVELKEPITAKSLANDTIMKYHLERLTNINSSKNTLSNNQYQPFEVDGMSFDNNPTLGMMYIKALTCYG